MAFVTFQLRRGTADEWALENPVLAENELGVESDTGRLKRGDGETPWNSLLYGGLKGRPGPEGFPGLEVGEQVQVPIRAETPGMLPCDGMTYASAEYPALAALLEDEQAPGTFTVPNKLPLDPRLEWRIQYQELSE